MVLSEIFRGNNEVREAARAGVQIDTVSVASASDAASAADGSGKITGAIRPSAVAGSFYPADRTALKQLINQQLDYGRKLLQQLEPTLPAGVPRAVIVPHAGYIYSGTAAALAYALLERGRGSVTRAVIVGPTHRVAVRGVACSTAAAFETPLGTVPVDIAAERKALGLSVNEPLRSGTHARPGASAPAMIVNGPTHAQEHAVEVQIPFLQTVLGPDLTIVPLNAGDATPQEAGDVLRALWGGPETVIVISSDLSHYHPHEVARALDDQTIADIAALHLPIHPRRACGAYPINGLLDVLKGRKDMKLFELGCSTSGDDGVVALAGQPRPAMRDADEPVVGYVSFAAWESKPEADAPAGADDLGASGTPSHGEVLLKTRPCRYPGTAAYRASDRRRFDRVHSCRKPMAERVRCLFRYPDRGWPATRVHWFAGRPPLARQGRDRARSGCRHPRPTFQPGHRRGIPVAQRGGIRLGRARADYRELL